MEPLRETNPAGDLDARIREQLAARLVAADLTTALVAHGVLGGLAVLLFWSTVPHGLLLAWLALIAATTLTRVLVVHRLTTFPARGPADVRLLRWVFLALAAAWGVGPAMVVPYAGLPGVLVFMVIVGALVVGAGATLLPDPTAYFGAAALLLGGTLVAVLVDGQTGFHLGIALLLVLFGLIVARFYVLAHRDLVHHYRVVDQARASELDARRERAHLAALLESAPTAIATLDAGGTILAVNPAFEHLFDYAAADAVGRAINDLIVPEAQHAEAERFDQTVGRGSVVVTQAERRRRDGSLVTVRISASLAPRGADKAVFVLYDDVTEVRQAELRLREAEAKYRTLVESAGDLVWQVDREGRWTFLNQTAEQIYGLSPRALLGHRFAEVLDPAYLERDLATFLEVLTGKELKDYQTVHRDVHGRARSLSLAARPLRDEYGTVIGATGIARDVTDRVAVQRALEEAREAAIRTARAKSAFLANTSHEIRTPLNGILGMVELLLDSPLDPEQRRAAELVRESGEALLTVINDILDFSKMEAGRLELEETEFDLPALIESTVRLLSVKAFERGLELVSDIEPDVPHGVLGDPGRFRQILNNLLGNALKFTHQGEVALTASLVGQEQGVARVRVSVRDTGIGIPPEKFSTIFEEFGQADVTTTRKYGGTGLGLAITRRLVEMLGSTLEVRSEPGTGSEFFFTVALKVVRAEPAAVAAAEWAGTDVPALIIDDNGTNRRIVREMLRPVGVLVQEAADAEAGLAALRGRQAEGQPFRLVILDGHMPGRDGFQIAEEIRADPALAATRLMMLTSAGQPGDGQRCRELGILGYLSKPASRAELVETVTAVLQGAPTAQARGTLITRHLIQESRQRLRILLAEDNPVNQQVAATMLRRRGHDVVIAENGQEAVDHAADSRFDVVLMDVQMPVMDGFDATRAIRGTPAGADLPIIALTAHALTEERERCLEAGMSGYLAKPFKPHDLFALVERWAAAPKPQPVPDPEPGPGRAPAVDLDGFRALMREAGVEEAVPAMLEVFVRDAPGRMTALEEAAARQDAPAIEASAHAFKSASGTIGARALADRLATIERAARGGDPGAAREALAGLRAEYEAVMRCLAAATPREAGRA